VGVSYATSEPSYERISGLTFATVTDEQKSESRASWSLRDVVGSATVLILILMAYLYFRG
jgi:SSS family solute:Na+ symporter